MGVMTVNTGHCNNCVRATAANQHTPSTHWADNHCCCRAVLLAVVRHDRPGVRVPARLCQVPAGCDAQLQRQVLQEHREDVADQDDKQQAVAILGAAGQACRPVAWVPGCIRVQGWAAAVSLGDVSHQARTTAAADGAVLAPCLILTLVA